MKYFKVVCLFIVLIIFFLLSYGGNFLWGLCFIFIMKIKVLYNW